LKFKLSISEFFCNVKVKIDTNELQSVPDAVMAVERAITVDKVDFLTGAQRTEAVLGMQDVAMDYKTIFISTVANHPELCERIAKNYERYKYFFRLFLPNTIHAAFAVNALTETVADTIRKELGIKTPKVAIIAERAAHADLVTKISQERLPKMGMEVVGVWRPSALASDVTAELSAIKAAGAQIMQTTFTGPGGIVVSKALGEMKIPVAAVGWSTDVMDLAFWQTSGGKGEYEATWISISRVKITDKTIPFYDKWKRRSMQIPSAAYDASYVLKEAIEKAGTLDPAALVVQLEKTDHIGVLGRQVFSGRTSPYPHDITYGPGYVTGTGIQWVAGEPVPFWPHGGAVLGDRGWVDHKYEGTKNYVLPPWMKEYWKGKK
jgi:branched-chain amino acid transport system substrate-binding protein